MRIGINGFGRIGRNFTKALLERHPGVEIAAVNDLTSPAECAHLFKYDSKLRHVRGKRFGQHRWNLHRRFGDQGVGRTRSGKKFRGRPWASTSVIESTGLFTDASKARAHIDGGGAKKVIISAPAKGEDITLVLGVNGDAYDPRETSRHLQRLVHDQLPRNGGQTGRRSPRLGEGLYDDRALVHERSEHSRCTPQGFAAAHATPRPTSYRRRPVPRKPCTSRFPKSREPSMASPCACRRRPFR